MTDQLPDWAIFALLVLAWLSREGYGIYLKWRSNRMAEVHADEDRHLSGYQLLIGELKARVAKLEEAITSRDAKHDSEVAALRAEHVGCLEKQAALTAQVAKLEAQVEALWRHDQANKKQVENMQAAIASRSTGEP